MPSFPGSIYARPDPIPALRSTVPTLSTILGQYGDEIELIESTLGVNPQGGSATVDARFDLIEGAWSTYVPVLGGAGWAIGNGTITGRYLRLGVAGKTVIFGAVVTFGSTSTFGAAQPEISLPFTALNNPASGIGNRTAINAEIFDATGSAYVGRAHIITGGLVCFPFVTNTGGPYAVDNNITSTVPFTFAASDSIRVFGPYEIA